MENETGTSPAAVVTSKSPWPEWLQKFPQRQRRFCRICGRPVLVASLPSRHGSIDYDFEPGGQGRYTFGGMRMVLHGLYCPSPEIYLDQIRIEGEVTLTAREAWLALWAAISRKLERS